MLWGLGMFICFLGREKLEVMLVKRRHIVPLGTSVLFTSAHVREDVWSFFTMSEQ
jgi:hypothetical protein